MQNKDDNNSKRPFKEENIIKKKNNNKSTYIRINKSIKITKNTNKSISNNEGENKNCFRKRYNNDKIKNKNINRTLSDIYETINSINKINKKIYKIFNKRKNSKENIIIKNAKKIPVRNKIFNEFKNKSNKTKNKKELKRAYYSCDNIKEKIIHSKLTNDKINKQKSDHLPNKIDDQSIIYISSYITEELNKNEIYNKLNYDYNDFHLSDKLNNFQKKLKTSQSNQTSDSVINFNHFKNSKNIKDIILLEKYKQKEFQKLENIKNLKNNYLRNISSENKNRFEVNNQNDNKKYIKKRPFCFNDNINIVEISKKRKNSFSKNYNKDNVNNYFNKYFSINDENENNESKNQNIFNQNYNTSIINKLNFNYQIYRNILSNK